MSLEKVQIPSQRRICPTPAGLVTTVDADGNPRCDSQVWERTAMDEAKPGSVLTTEFPGYDFLMPYLDGALTNDLIASTKSVGLLRPVSFNLQKFYFPECKAYSGDDNPPADPEYRKRFLECGGIVSHLLSRGYGHGPPRQRGRLFEPGLRAAHRHPRPPRLRQPLWRRRQNALHALQCQGPCAVRSCHPNPAAVRPARGRPAPLPGGSLRNRRRGHGTLHGLAT
jgi:hypothetical protein